MARVKSGLRPFNSAIAFSFAARTSCGCSAPSPFESEKPLACDPMTMIDRRFPPDEEHRSEPEIIPPGRGDGGEPESTFWVRDVERGSHRIYVTKIGRFGLLPFFLLGGIISIALLIFVLGAFLILIPVAGVVLAAAIIAGLLRGYPRWPR